MARYNHLPIFQLAYKTCLNTYKIAKNFQKEHKYTLGEKLKNNSHEIIDFIIETNSLPNEEKFRTFGKLFLSVEKQKIYWRIACDLKIISIGLAEIIFKDMEELEKQSANWLNWVKLQNKKINGGGGLMAGIVALDSGINFGLITKNHPAKKWF
jgi:hypothetical protein